MRTLNVRLAVILLLIIVLGGAGVFFIHYIQQYRNAYFFLEQANIAKQDLENAKKRKNRGTSTGSANADEKHAMVSVVQANDLDVRKNWACSWPIISVDGNTFNQIFFNQAIGRLDKVVRDDPTRNYARRKLIDLLMLKEILYRRLEIYSTCLRSRRTIRSCCSCGSVSTGYSRVENAQKSYEKAIKYSPSKSTLTRNWPTCCVKTWKSPKRHTYACKTSVKNNPESAKAYIYLGSYWESMEKEEAKKATGNDDIEPKEEAMKAAEKAVELAPDDQDALLLAARCAIALDKPEQARKYTEHNLEIHKDSPVIYTTLAEIIVRAGDKEKAIEILNRGLKETKNSPQILWYKVNFLIDLRKLDEARSHRATANYAIL